MNNETKQYKLLIINGPNLSMLGKREPEIYGSVTLEDINCELIKLGKKSNFSINTYQSNHEGEIVQKIQDNIGNIDGLIINPAAYTHSSIAIRDAILMLKIPVIEIHLSNIYKRESFRHKSLISDIATGQISGFGVYGYHMAFNAMVNILNI